MKRPVLSGLTGCFLTVFPLVASALFTSEPVTRTTETLLYQYDVRASSNTTDAVSIRLIEGPKGMTLTSQNNLVWQTGYDDAGQHTVILEASDGSNSVRQQFTITVANKNRQPLISSVPVAVIEENELFSYTVQAVDPDGNEPRIQFLEVPRQVRQDGHTLTWQTDYKSAGIYPVHIRVSDDESHTDQTFVLEVRNRNRLPVFTAIDPALLKTSENDDWQLAVEASDPDGENITLSLLNAPEGLTLQGNLLRWKPTFRQAGSHTLTVKASDGKDTSSLPLMLEVANVNRLPAFLSQPPARIDESMLFQYDIRAYDPDETPLSYKLLQGPKGMTLNGHQLVWQTGFDDAGEYPVSLQVSDGEALITQDFTLTVANKNRPVAILSSPVTRINEGERFRYTLEASDPDSDPFTVEYLEIPAQISRKDNVMSWQTDFKSAGSYPFHIRVSEAESSVDQTFVLEVVNINHAPVITSKPPLKAIEVVDYLYAIEAHDDDDEPLTFVLEQAPQGMTLQGNILSWKPGFDQSGKRDVVLAVSDGIDTVRQSFTVSVADTNREPTLADVDDQTVYAGDTFRYTLQASDVDGDKVTVDLVRAPSGMKVSRSHELSWRTREQDLGDEHIIIVRVSDGDLNTRKHFRLRVIAKPVEPPPAETSAK